MGLASLGKCNDAFEIRGRGIVLGYLLYAKDSIKTGERVKAKIVKEGREIAEANAEFGIVFGCKRHRYDMATISVTIVDSVSKTDLIGSNIYLECDYEFWQPNVGAK